MKKKIQIQILALLAIAAFSLAGCSIKKEESAAKISQTTLPTSGNPADEQGVLGVPGASVPTSKAIPLRIANGLMNRVTPLAGNFGTAMNQLGVNLPESTNPNLATGVDQVPLLAYAACTDVLPSAYGITENQAGTRADILTARPKLIAAGMNILDQHMAGLASSGPHAAQAAAIFGSLVDQNAAISGETVRMAFISVCMAANVFGTQMMGY